MLSGPKLSEVIADQANSLTLVRLLAALAVVVSHSFEIPLGREAPQPLGLLTPYNLGQHAVNAFFIISGLTLSQSVDRNADLRRFILARCLRIFPGLIAFGVVFAFLFGPLLTSRSLAEYFSDAHTYLYPFNVLFSFNEATPPHGIFDGVPVAGTVNEPLWTIRYELAAYAGLAVLVASGLFMHSTGLFLAAATVLGYYVLLETVPTIGGSVDGFANLARLAFCFMLGVMAYAHRDRLILSPVMLVASLPLLWLLNDTALARPAYFFFTAYLVFILGATSFGPFSRWGQRTDISYGTYLYGWPIQQSLVVMFPGIAISMHVVAALLLSSLAGVLSWHLVEKRALKLKGSLSATLHRASSLAG